MTQGGAAAPPPRWWRRSRDEALGLARAAHQEATEAMARLESLEVDLAELSRIDAAADAARAGADPSAHSTPMSTAWDILSVSTGMVALRYAELVADYDPAKDYEEPAARTYAEGFRATTARLREVLPEVERFRAQHGRGLDAAATLRDRTPDLLDEA
ncbi:MAG TPA: hypothetical protein VN088_00005, partial [Nocardioides sp.]|nr:hypothetical protein [Nocardioides sp.]